MTQTLTLCFQVLRGKNIPFQETGPFCLVCKSKSVVFETEICQLPFLNLNGVRFRRISGNAWEYKAICKEILYDLDLKEEFSKNTSKSTAAICRSKEKGYKEKQHPSAASKDTTPNSNNNINKNNNNNNNNNNNTSNSNNNKTEAIEQKRES
jgi:hypothetical protein